MVTMCLWHVRAALGGRHMAEAHVSSSSLPAADQPALVRDAGSHGISSYSAGTLTVAAGPHNITLLYSQNTGNAGLQLRGALATVPPGKPPQTVTTTVSGNNRTVLIFNVVPDPNSCSAITVDTSLNSPLDSCCVLCLK